MKLASKRQSIPSDACPGGFFMDFTRSAGFILVPRGLGRGVG